ncbi:MEKHLA domain-containing protein [Pavlovales sp. CCMP2436]|nr:MEKHLA domain-containing protein [Pavlovales sp. CCMP2436]
MVTLLRVGQRRLSASAGRPLAPSAANAYLLEHARLLNGSLLRLTGRSFLPTDPTADDARLLAANAELVVVSHGVDAPEPVFNYATRAGLELWEIEWDALVCLPSSKSAEQVERSERLKLLDEVRANGFIADYTGIRVSAKGRRFMISNALVWDVRDEAGVLRGQACTFERSKLTAVECFRFYAEAKSCYTRTTCASTAVLGDAPHTS